MLGRVLGPFRIEREIGAGGMGTVYAATLVEGAAGLSAGSTVALKVVHPHLLETPGFFKRFLREAQIGRGITHPNVVRTFDADAIVEGGRTWHYLVMEHVEGQTLRELLDELRVVPEELCRHLAGEVCRGLAAVHERGVVHRDLKPENVIVATRAARHHDGVAERSSAPDPLTGGAREGNVIVATRVARQDDDAAERPNAPDHGKGAARDGSVRDPVEYIVKVMDLGVARLADEVLRLSQTGAFVGSVEYAAPEQFRGGEVSAATDLHALGILLYELASGVHPYRSDDFRAAMHRICAEEPRRLGRVQPQVSAFFEEVVHTLLAKQPASRFASAEALARILDQGEASTWWQERAREIRTATRSPLRRVRVPRETAVYGREPELAQLRDLFARAASGDGQVVLIEGEAGIGKTRLVDELVGALQRDGEELHFLFASYPPGGAATATGAFSTAFREQLGDDGSGELLSQTPGLVTAFDALLRGEPPPPGVEPLSREALQTCFVHTTRALAAERAVVLLIDDLHFAPEEALALFSAVAMGIAGHRVLLVGTARRGLSEQWLGSLTRLDHATHLQLSRLGPKDLVQLLQDTLHSESSAQLLAGQIALKSDGNPFFVFEIIRGLREGQFLTKQEDGSWVSTAIIEEIQIPSSVLDLVNARVAPLDEEDRDLLDLAACCGFEFDPLVVARALGLQPIPVLKTLRRIEQRHRLVRAAGRHFVFDHHQVQEWLYQGMPDLLRENYHALVGDAIEAAIPQEARADLPGAVAVQLATHFLQGAVGERALPYVEAALAQLDAGHLLADAAQVARRALDVPGLLGGARRFDVQLDLARWLGVLGHRDEEIAACEAALTLAEEIGDRRRIVRALSGRAVHLGNTAHYADALAACERALRIAEEEGLDDQRPGLLRFVGTLQARRGRYEEARRLHEECLAACRAIGDKAAEATVENGLGALASHLGQFDEAEAHHRRSAELAREVGDAVGEAIALGDLGVTAHERGRLDEALRCFERCHEVFVRTGDRYGEANALANLGEVWLALGDVRRGRDQLDAAASLGHEIGYEPLAGFRDSILGTFLAQEGRADDAQRLLDRALTSMTRWGTPRELADIEISLGELRLIAGDVDGARALLDSALERAESVGAPNQIALAAAVAARLPDGDTNRAERLLTEHGPQMRVRDRMRAWHALWTATGNPVHAQRAHELLEHLRDRAPASSRAAMMETVRLHGEIAHAAEQG